MPYRAQALVGGTTIADSTAARRLDTADAAPLLFFPRDDVDPAALERLDRSAWRTGAAELADHVAFDHERVVLELIDAVDGDAEADITVKRFPLWGDASDLIDVLDVQADGAHRFLSAARSDWRRPVVEGSQMLAQAIVAGSRASGGRRAVAASMVFPRAGDARLGYAIELDEVSLGRTFATYGVQAVQGGRVCATGTVLLDVTAPSIIEHAEPVEITTAPHDAVPYDMGVTGRDLRVVDATYTGDPDAPTGPPEIDAWVRFRSVPDDPAIHAGLLAQFTGHLSIAAALRPHAGIGQNQAHVTLSTAINAISIAFHADIRADRWMRYRHRSTWAGDGMTHAECRVHDEQGTHLASFTVEAMVRGFADPSRGDARTAL